MIKPEHSLNENHSHEDHTAHSHSHGVIDPTLAANERGIWALKWSFVGLLIAALFQVVVVYYSASVALLADTIHNFGDAATAVPLWLAFALARRKPAPVHLRSRASGGTCIGITRDVMKTMDRGKSLKEMCAQIEKTYSKCGPSAPTPPVP